MSDIVPERERFEVPQIRAAVAPTQFRHILSLSGGGFRGLFTAKVLEGFEENTLNKRSVDYFDMVAGTSIGAIIASGLVFGIPAEEITQQFVNDGKYIFQRRKRSLWGLVGSKYSSIQLEKTIRLILKDKADVLLSDLGSHTHCHLLITTVDKTNGRLRVLKSFESEGIAPSNVSVLNACLASAAAPTFFPPHTIDGTRYVDGGIAANAPDNLAFGSAKEVFNTTSDFIRMMSVGTMGQRPIAIEKDQGELGMIAWAIKHGLFQLLIGVQEEMAIRFALNEYSAEQYLRIDSSPAREIRLDHVSEQVKSQLISGATLALKEVRRSKMSLWNKFCTNEIQAKNIVDS